METFLRLVPGFLTRLKFTPRESKEKMKTFYPQRISTLFPSGSQKFVINP